MEENFSMEWNMEWKIFSMEWKWNGRKFPVWNMEKSSSIPFHTMPRIYVCEMYGLIKKSRNLANWYSGVPIIDTTYLKGLSRLCIFAKARLTIRPGF